MAKCSACGGDGFDDRDKCLSCDGTGVMPEELADERAAVVEEIRMWMEEASTGSGPVTTDMVDTEHLDTLIVAAKRIGYEQGKAWAEELAAALRYELTHHHTSPVDCRAEERDRHISLLRAYYKLDEPPHVPETPLSRTRRSRR